LPEADVPNALLRRHGRVLAIESALVPVLNKIVEVILRG